MKIKGGMKKNWLSDLAKSKDFTDLVKTSTESVKKLAETKIKADYPNNNFNFHYGSIIISGKWGSTGVIWPTSNISIKKDLLLKSSAEGNNLRLKKGS